VDELFTRKYNVYTGIVYDRNLVHERVTTTLIELVEISSRILTQLEATAILTLMSDL
jgi:hypothetical protein